MPERDYLFLNCDDIRRIRADLASGGPQFQQVWDALRARVDLVTIPDLYHPAQPYPTLFSGSANYTARDKALVYLVTGDSRYGEDAIKLLNLVYENTPKNNHLVNFDQPTSSGEDAGGLMSHPQYGEVLFQSVLFAYLAVRDGNLLNDEQRQQFDDFFVNQAFLLEEAAKFRGNEIPITSLINRNVPLGANVAAATIALAFPDIPRLQDLYKRVLTRLDWQLAHWWHADGGWGEDTNWYGYRVLEGLIGYAETLYKLRGENIYDKDFGGNSIHTFCSYFLNSLTPEGDPPQINDTGWSFFDPGLLMLCGTRTNDGSLTYAAQQVLWGYANELPNPSFTPFETVAWWDPRVTQDLIAPDWTSILLHSTGLGIFRSDWSHEAQYGLLKYTSSAVHNHYSFGEFFLYDHGPWLTGNGYQQDQFSMDTTSSSTLTMDNKAQTEIGGELVAFEPLGQTACMAVKSASYPNLTHTRSVFWVRSWHQWIVVDDAAISGSTNGHSLQLRWYVQGVNNGGGNSQGIWTRLNNPGYLSIDMVSQVPPTFTAISRDTFTVFKEGNSLGVQMEVEPDEKNTRLVTLFNYSPDEPSTVLISTHIGKTGTVITTKPLKSGQIWDWLIGDPENHEVNYEEYKLNGNAGCIWREATHLQGYCLYEGDTLQSGNLSLVSSGQKISVEVDFALQTITLQNKNEASITFYWPSSISMISENGESKEFTIENNQVTIDLPAGEHVLTVTP